MDTALVWWLGQDLQLRWLPVRGPAQLDGATAWKATEACSGLMSQEKYFQEAPHAFPPITPTFLYSLGKETQASFIPGIPLGMPFGILF